MHYFDDFVYHLAMNTNNQMMIFFCQYNLGHMACSRL